MTFREQKASIYDVLTGSRCYYLSVRLLVHPMAARTVFWSNRWNWHPNHLSLACAFFSLVCFYYFFNGHYVTAFVFFYIRTFLDYADGALARYAKKFSTFGKWLDRIIDEIFYLGLWLLIAYKAGFTGVGGYFLASALAYRYAADYFVEPRLPLLQRRATIKKFFLDRGIILGCGVFTVLEFWTLLVFALGVPHIYIAIPVALCNLDLIYRVYEILRYARPSSKVA